MPEVQKYQEVVAQLETERLRADELQRENAVLHERIQKQTEMIKLLSIGTSDTTSSNRGAANGLATGGNNATTTQIILLQRANDRLQAEVNNLTQERELWYANGNARADAAEVSVTVPHLRKQLERSYRRLRALEEQLEVAARERATLEGKLLTARKLITQMSEQQHFQQRKPDLERGRSHSARSSPRNPPLSGRETPRNNTPTPRGDTRTSNGAAGSRPPLVSSPLQRLSSEPVVPKETCGSGAPTPRSVSPLARPGSSGVRGQASPSVQGGTFSRSRRF